MNLPVSLGTYHGHRAFVRARRIADPAGCGDTYRARVIHAGLDHREWETTERIAPVKGVRPIELRWTRNHNYIAREFPNRCHSVSGRTIRSLRDIHVG
jgi:adenosine kinase